MSEDERVLRDFRKRNSLRAIMLQHRSDEILGVLRDRLLHGELQVDLADSSVGLIVLRCEERWCADEKLVHQHSQAPGISRVIVLPALNHLRREVIQRAAQSLATINRGVNGPPKIGDLDLTFLTQKEILHGAPQNAKEGTSEISTYKSVTHARTCASHSPPA